MLQNPSTRTPAQRRQTIDSQLETITELIEALRNDQITVDDERRFKVAESFLTTTVQHFLSSVRVTAGSARPRPEEPDLFLSQRLRE